MSRKRLLARGVLVGYIAMAIQIFYSLASIPLALSYMSQAEFGMFSVITTVISYIGLSEFGMTNGFNRHLFECKDGSNPELYGRYFTAGMIALSLVAVLMLFLGAVAIFLSASFFRIPENLIGQYRWIMMGMVIVSAFHMATRIFCTPLYVHQRHDLMQFSQIVQYAIMYIVLYYGLRAGWGTYALLANTAASQLWNIAFSLVMCNKLGLYPKKGCWKSPSTHDWKSVLGYSSHLFQYQLGSKLAGSIPMLLLPRLLGLDAVAAWTVCSRTFSIIKQFVAKPYDYTLPLLCEMHVRNESTRMIKRWSDITRLLLTLSVCALSVTAANNSFFVEIWTSGRISWPPLNDWLMALYFIVGTFSMATMGSVGFEKEIGLIRFTPYLSAVLILVNVFWMTSLWGVSGLLLSGIVASLLSNIPFGLRHLAKLSGRSARSLAVDAIGPVWLLIPLAASAAWACGKLHDIAPGYAGLLISATTGSLLVFPIGYFIGIPKNMRIECIQMLMKPFGRFTKVGRGRTAAQ